MKIKELLKCPMRHDSAPKMCMHPFSDAHNCEDVTNCIIKEALSKESRDTRDMLLGVVYEDSGK